MCAEATSSQDLDACYYTTPRKIKSPEIFSDPGPYALKALGALKHPDTESRACILARHTFGRPDWYESDMGCLFHRQVQTITDVK